MLPDLDWTGMLIAVALAGGVVGVVRAICGSLVQLWRLVDQAGAGWAARLGGAGAVAAAAQGLAVRQAIDARIAEIDRQAVIKARKLQLDQAAAIGPMLPCRDEIGLLADDMTRHIEAVLGALGGVPDRYDLRAVQLDPAAYAALLAILACDPRTSVIATHPTWEGVLVHRVLARARYRWAA